MLPKINRLKKNSDFKQVFKKGRTVKSDLFDLRIAANAASVCRFGFLAGLKVSKKATQRNKIRRQLNEAARALIGEIKPGYDIIVIAKREVIGKKNQEIFGDFKEAIKEANLNV